MNLSDKRIFTIPNLISIIRILLIFPFVATFITDNYLASAVILVLSGISDMLDGLIARKFNQISEMGLILDELRRIESCSEISDDFLAILNLVSKTVNEMNNEQ